MRTFAAWVLGIASVLALFLFFARLGYAIGVTTWIDFGEPVLFSNRYYEEEKEGALSNFGWATTALSVMIGARIGMAVRRGSIRNHLSPEQSITFNAWFSGIALLAVLSVILDIAFAGARSSLVPYVTTAVLAGAAYGLYRWLSKRRSDRLRELSRADNN